MFRKRITIIAAIALFLMLPTAGNMGSPSTSSIADFIPETDGYQVAADPDAANWWNSTYIYRRYVNVSEPGLAGRTLVPVHVYLEFENGHCYGDSIRVLYYTDPDSVELPFQVWNTTYDSTGNYILSTRVSFMVNVTLSSFDQNYYIYYAKEDVGSVSYPNFYPFVYKSYTFSLVNLASYYDDNNYFVEKWDDATERWVDPRTIDTRWSSSQVTPDNVPSGMLDAFEVMRYEPTAHSYTPGYFWGSYAVYSNYPMAVSMGQGNIGQNSIVNDWWPGVDQVSSGTGTEYVLGGVEGASGGDKGKYWIQAVENHTEVYVWTALLIEDTGWEFYNGSSVLSWPATLKEGEYISKKNVFYTSYLYVNTTAPVITRQGDVDSSYARDIMGFYPDINGALAGEEFFMIDMGNNADVFRLTNLGDSNAIVSYRRKSTGGWSTWTSLGTIGPNGSSTIAKGSAGSSDPEDILHVKSSTGSMLMIEGIYNYATMSNDEGDWAPATTGDRFGTTFKLWGVRSWKFMFVATEAAEVTITGYNGGTVTIPAGGVSEFRPWSTSASLFHIVSNTSIGVVDVGQFSTSSPYAPTGDTGYGWQVPAYVPEQDQNGISIMPSNERHLFEFDITVVDVDGFVVEGATVGLYVPGTGVLWEDLNTKTRTGTSDSNGLVIFEGLDNETYEIRVEIDAKSWLTTSLSSVVVQKYQNESIVGSVSPVTITLPMGSFDVHYEDLIGNVMAQTADETTTIRASTDGSGDGSSYYGQTTTNSTGWASFYRLPVNDYSFFAQYTGNVSSYSYVQMKEYGTWSLSSSDFGNGPFSKNFVLPLVTLNLNVLSWDDLAVEGAYIKITNSLDTLEAYPLTRITDANGDYVFYRVVNGTWSVDVWKNDDYPDTPVVRNDTVSLDNIQGEYSKTIELALTRLIVQVKTDPVTVVIGAQVNITLIDSGLIAQGVTNSTGHVTFFNIHGNMSSPYLVAYNLTVQSGDQKNDTVTSIKCDYDWRYINVIYITTPTYNDYYTELNSTKYYITVKYGQNATFTVGYYDRDDSGTGTVSLDASSWVNFSIYLEGAYIGTGSWAFTGPGDIWVSQSSPINFDMIVSTFYWGLDVSDSPYTIRINAHTDSPWLNPAEILVYITVQNAQTSTGIGDASISEYYKTHDSHDFWLIDITSNPDVNLTSLDFFTYSVKEGASEVRNGALITVSHIYQLPEDALHGLEVGTYTLTVFLGKQNYLNQSVIIDIEITAVPMAVSNINFGSYVWDTTGQSFTFSYIFNFDGNTTNPDLAAVYVSVQWLTYSGGIAYGSPIVATIDSVSNEITFDFPGDHVPSGNWNVSITCSKDNYGMAIGYLTSPVIVLDAPTILTSETSSSVITPWQTSAVIEVRFARVSGDVGLIGASLAHNWTDSVSLIYQGDGVYRITLATSIAADIYPVRLTLSATNHENSFVEATVTILIPLLIESDYSSAEDPLETYWTRMFNISVMLLDQSRGNAPVEGAIPQYTWHLQFVVDKSGTLANLTGGLYYVTLNAQDAIPLDDLYNVFITVTMPGASDASVTIFVKISAVPNEIVIPMDYEFMEAYYADSFALSFYWNNTLDNEAIKTFDIATYRVLGITDNITTGVNNGNGWYTIIVNTAALSMNAAEQGTVYMIRITMFLDGFQAHEFAYSIILVKETPASLVVESIDRVNWSDSFDITARLYDAEHGGLIYEGATVTVLYGVHSEVMTYNSLEGTFTASIQSDEWFAASTTPYALTFTYILPNYIDSANTTAVFIDPIPGIIIKELPVVYEYTWTNTFLLRVEVHEDYGTRSPLQNVMVYYQWSGTSELYPLTYYFDIYDFYNVTVLTGAVPAGTYDLLVIVDNENYTIPALTIPVVINKVDTSLESDFNSYEVYYGDTGLAILLNYSVADSSVDLTGPLAGAIVSMNYAGSLYNATYQSGIYRLNFNPSEMNVSLVPGQFTLTITAHRPNYEIQTINPILTIVARTSLSGPEILMEEGQPVVVVVQYLDISSGVPIGPDTITSLTLVTSTATYEFDDFTWNGTHYSITLTSEQIGPVRAEAYQLQINAEAPLYESQDEQVIRITISEAMIDVLGFIPLPFLQGLIVLPVSQFQLILMMSVIFIGAVAIGVGVRRWRVPYQIKQINKAVGAMEDGKHASVDNIKNMGMVVSELLAAGLAEFDIAAPIIDVVAVSEYEDILTDDTEELLDELDALDGIGVDDSTPSVPEDDFESELAAELDDLVEDSDVAAVPEPEPEPEPAIGDEEVEVDSEDVPEPEFEQEPDVEVEEAEAEVVSEPEWTLEAESEEVFEEPKEPSEDEPEADVEEFEEEEPELESDDVDDEDFEQDDDSSDYEEESTEDFELSKDEAIVDDTEENLDDDSSNDVLDDEPDEAEPLSKAELIERLPDEIKESMSEDELKKLSKKELEALLTSIEHESDLEE